MVCKRISVWINIWTSALCPTPTPPSQPQSSPHLPPPKPSTGSQVRLHHNRQNQRRRRWLCPVTSSHSIHEEVEHVKGLRQSEPPVVAAASSTRHGCIYRAPLWMSHLAPCPLFLRQIYGSPLQGGLLDLRPTLLLHPPPTSPSPPRLTPASAGAASQRHRKTISPLIRPLLIGFLHVPPCAASPSLPAEERVAADGRATAAGG